MGSRLPLSFVTALSVWACAAPQPAANGAAPRLVVATPAPVAPAAELLAPEPSEESRRRDTLGGAAMLQELASLPRDAKQAFAQQDKLFRRLEALNDPGAAETLVSVLSSKPHPYFETRAALALGALGDVRAAPYLARRLGLDPLKVYSDDVEWEQRLKRDDNERVSAARLLADLATLHPEARELLLAKAEDALWAWLDEMPSPHANGMRALAALGSQKQREKLRAWANPQVPLPREGQQPPLPEEWVISQSAQRYVGQLQDAPSWLPLLQALQRRPADVDTSMSSLMEGGNAVLIMSLRALWLGAADGLAEWRDARAFGPLLEFVTEPRNNEFAQLQAGAALGWVGTDRDLQRLAQQLASAGKAPVTERARACLLQALSQRPVPNVAELLVPALSLEQPDALRDSTARALSRSGLDAKTAARLGALQQTDSTAVSATLALMLGGSTEQAKSAVQRFAEKGELSALHEPWYRSFDFFTQDDVANGTLFRYLANADAIAQLTLRGQAQTFARSLLEKNLANLVYDNGPHSVTRVVLVQQLRRVARGRDAARAISAIHALGALREAGTLLDFRRGTGPLADAARAEYENIVAR